MYTCLYRICVDRYVCICAIYTSSYMCSEQLPDRIFQKYCMKNIMVLVELMNACLFANRFVCLQL